MNQKEQREILSFTRSILECPTAPFHEDHVLCRIAELLKAHNIPFQADKAGNLIARLKNGKEVPPIAFIAHTDHPGFEVTRVKGKEVIANFMGGVYLEKSPGTGVKLFTKEGILRGKVVGVRKSGKEKFLRIRVKKEGKIVPGDFGMFDFLPFSVRAGRLYSRAVDDLVGCSALLSLLVRLSREKRAVNLYACFTRAEEVGFIGTLHLIAKKTIPKKTLIVSIETSKAHPSALIGGGPVLRVGDRTSLFSPEADWFFSEVARNLSRKNRNFQFQRFLMGGGTCEATPFSAAGYSVFGMAFPLGNYHNMTLQGKIAPEYVALTDFFNGILFLERAVENLPRFRQGRSDYHRRLASLYQQWKPRLLKSAKPVISRWLIKKGYRSNTPTLTLP